MSRGIVTTYLLLGFSTASFSASVPEIQRENLKGPVHTVRTEISKSDPLDISKSTSPVLLYNESLPFVFKPLKSEHVQAHWNRRV